MENLTSPKKRKKGVALILTMSIMLLLSVILTETFKENAQEIRLLENGDTRFQLDIVSTSVLGAFTKAVTLYGANRIYSQTQLLGNTFPLTENADIQNFRLWSIDHFIYINDPFTGNDGLIRKKLIENAFNTYVKGVDNQSSYYPQTLGQLADFTDTDEKVFNENGLPGAEIYPQVFPAFSVKNNNMDFLTELNILPAFQKAGFIKQPSDLDKLPFRTKKRGGNLSGDRCFLGALNLNMTPVLNEEKFEPFFSNHIKLFDRLGDTTICPYESIFINQNSIRTGILEYFSGLEAKAFTHPLKSDSAWKNILNQAGLDPGKVIDLFSARSDLIGLSYQVSVRGVLRSIETHFRLKYKSTKEIIPKSIEIIYYKIR